MTMMYSPSAGTLKIQQKLFEAGLPNMTTTFVETLAEDLAETEPDASPERIREVVDGFKKNLKSKGDWLEQSIAEHPYWKVKLGTLPVEVAKPLKALLKVTLTHQVIDQETTQTYQKHNVSVSCKKGCSACCHYPVAISDTEAYLLALLLKYGDVQVDKDLLESQQNLAFWRKTSHKETRCIFLSKENTCSVYRVRPSACRSYAVVSDPEVCKIGDARVKAAVVPEAELFSSLQIIGNSDIKLLPQKVKAQLDRLSGKDHAVFKELSAYMKGNFHS